MTVGFLRSFQIMGSVLIGFGISDSYNVVDWKYGRGKKEWIDGTKLEQGDALRKASDVTAPLQ